MELFVTYEPIMLAVVILISAIAFAYQYVLFPDDQERPRKYDDASAHEDPLFESSRKSLDLDLSAKEAMDQIRKIKDDSQIPPESPPYDI